MKIKPLKTSAIVAIFLIALYGLHVFSLNSELKLQLSDAYWQAAAEESERTLSKSANLETLERFLGDQELVLESSLSEPVSQLTPRIRDGHGKKVIWAKKTGRRERQKWSIVYLHGFSAGPLELEPTVSKLAERLNANLYFTRLSAHGLTDGESFATVKATDWVRDVTDAMAVGHILGENVLLIGMSTGAALALRYADFVNTRQRVSGLRAMILLSPNYRVASFGADILGNHLGPKLARVLVGRYREFAPENELHSIRWTTKYRSEALHELILVTLSARQVATEQLKIPVLTVYTKSDEVISVSEIENRASRFRNPNSRTIDWPDGQRHELASETFHPEMVEGLVGLMSDWFIKLEVGTRKNQNESSE